MYVLGIDAGGTKTHAAIGDEHGHILAEGFGGAANYQVCGTETTRVSLQKAIEDALAKRNENAISEQDFLTLSDISYAVFGMSGADSAEDYAVLNPLVAKIMGEVPFEVMHDAWIGLRAATEDNVGIVSICGTGAGHAGRNRNGEKGILRNLDYITGNYGGGGELVEEALHCAFRSDEGTGCKTSLESVIPEIFQTTDMEAVCTVLRHDLMTREQRFQIPIAVFTESRKGDAVCQKMIDYMGQTEGEYAAGLIKRLHMEKEHVPMVLIGSLFRTEEPLLIDAYMRAVHACAPDAYPCILNEPPVTGAVKLAADRLLHV